MLPIASAHTINLSQIQNANTEFDLFWAPLKNIFKEYATKELLTNEEKNLLDVSLQELEEYLIQNAEPFSSIPEEISELMAKDSTSFILSSAVTHDKCNLTKFFLNCSQIDINQLNDYGRNHLHIAFSKGDKKIVRLLLAHPKIDINKANANGWTPLRYACEEGYKEVVQLLLAHSRININIPDNYGYTPLHFACLWQQKEIVQLLLAHPQLDINKANNYGDTPLHAACSGLFIGGSEDYKKIVQLLLAHPQIDINKANNSGETPLHVAFGTANKKTIPQLLLQPSIKVNTHLGGETLFSFVCRQQWIEIEEILRECFGIDGNTPETPGVITAQASVFSYVLSKDNQDENWAEFKCLVRQQAPLFASNLFALTVFLCDDFLTFKSSITAADPTLRFFKIAQQLPLELQMILAQRAFGSMKNNILSKDSEAAFKRITNLFSLPQQIL